MNFLKKIKNNKGSAEGAMFVVGIMIFATIVVFSMDMFALTWQRYLATREIGNMSRLYAVRAYDLYLDDAGNRIEPSNSDLGKEMGDILEMVVKHTQIKSAEFTITTEGGVQVFKLESDGGLTAAGIDTIKQFNHETVLISKLEIEYNHSRFTDIGAQEDDESSYTISNKFAFESGKRDDGTIL